jgi:hypothetical protein
MEASITLDDVTLADPLIRWSRNGWLSVCRKIPVSADKMFRTSNKPSKWTPYILSIIKLRGMKWVWHVAWIREKRIVYNILLEKPEGERLLGRQTYSSFRIQLAQRATPLILIWIIRIWCAKYYSVFRDSPEIFQAGDRTVAQISHHHFRSYPSEFTEH